ncbi:lysozyme [Sphingomonas sp. BE270]|jgi:lysozyme|uniref:glycoside hydrolase family protein n=1 Tax=Sphingomonas sp. BE270 TaxID=2817726 RepID=UPI0028635657|nr:glycoside hydrolase family protein [Sphingomonas sp. BE270]MDR7257764.1 lysozyme [Sphingomonas sp. BE270]
MPSESRKLTPANKVGVGAGIGALIAAAVTLALPGTRTAEGSVYHAYPDSSSVWTICNGHTRGVRPGMTATKAQCDAWLAADLTDATSEAVAITPELLSGPVSLRGQAGDFILNAGAGRWHASPMAREAAAHRWRAACEAFRGYIVLFRPRGAVPKEYACKPSSKGVVYCAAPGLVNRREKERRDCLAGLAA